MFRIPGNKKSEEKDGITAEVMKRCLTHLKSKDSVGQCISVPVNDERNFNTEVFLNIGGPFLSF